MRRLLIALTMALIALPALAQTQTDWCASPSATDDQTIAGCNALIQSGRETAVALASDYNNLAEAFNDQNLSDQALAAANQSLALNGSSASAYTNRGLAYYGKGLDDLAIADFDRAIALAPDASAGSNDSGNAFAYNDRGLAYARKGLTDKAVADYSQAIAFEPRYAKAYFNRGLAYEKTGHRDMALADYRTATTIEPDNTRMKAALDRLAGAP
jgi:tetratricopeptide (TPR) repeat protein